MAPSRPFPSPTPAIHASPIPCTFCALTPLSHSSPSSESRECLGRVYASSNAEDKLTLRFERSPSNWLVRGFGIQSCSKKLRAFKFLAEREPGYGPSSSSSSSRNKLPDDFDSGNSDANQAEGSQDLSGTSNVADDSKSVEQLEEEQAARQREELARLAMEQARAKKEAEMLFQMSQRAYGRGVYDKSVEMLEAALTKVPGPTNLGGEIQIWLAMAYDAVGRHSDCIALYKRLEGSHPNKILRKQAADLRYILEAPKLKISRDEMVKIPLIEKDYDRKSKSWSQTMKDKRKRPTKKSPQSRDYLEDWLVWKPPRWEKSPYFWVALTIWLTLVGVSLIGQ